MVTEIASEAKAGHFAGLVPVILPLLDGGSSQRNGTTGDPDEKAHPVVNALSNACMQAARMQNAWQHALGALSRLPGTTSTIALHMPPSHGAAW